MSVEACCGGGGSSGPTLASGTYLPTLTPAGSPSIVSVAVASPFTYIRVGDIVHVSGLIDLEVSSLAAFVEWDVTLPVAVLSLSLLAGCLTMTSEPTSNDCFGQAGVVRANINAARCTVSTAVNNAPGLYQVAVQFDYLIS